MWDGACFVIRNSFRDHERYSLLARELQLAVNARAQQDQQQAPS